MQDIKTISTQIQNLATVPPTEAEMSETKNTVDSALSPETKRDVSMDPEEQQNQQIKINPKDTTFLTKYLLKYRLTKTEEDFDAACQHIIDNMNDYKEMVVEFKKITLLPDTLPVQTHILLQQILGSGVCMGCQSLTAFILPCDFCQEKNCDGCNVPVLGKECCTKCRSIAFKQISDVDLKNTTQE